MPAPIPLIDRRRRREPPREDEAKKAIELVKEALPLFRLGSPIRRPDGVDVPVLYLDFAIDRMHLNPETGTPLPKGFPGHFDRFECPDIKDISKILDELRVIDACEFREPEDCWIVPLAWKGFIVLHARVSRNGEELVPDYALTDEVRRHGL